MPSHDQNFKNLILDYPRDALELFAGDEAATLDMGAKIIPIREEQLKNRLGDRFRELDVPLLVEWPDGSREAILFVVEEDTDPRRFSIHRLAHYCLDLSEMFKTNRVVPVVIFLYAGDHTQELVLAGDVRNYLWFSFIKCYLKELSYEKYRESSNIVARLNLPNMNYRPEQKVDVYADALRGLRQLEPEPEKFLKYIDFIDIYANLDDKEYKLYVCKYPEEENVMSTFAERFREQGMQQGMQQGIEDLMEVKFGDNGMRLVPLIGKITDIERLREISRIIKYSQSVGEVERALEVSGNG